MFLSSTFPCLIVYNSEQFVSNLLSCSGTTKMEAIGHLIGYCDIIFESLDESWSITIKIRATEQ